jgi:hypothetical protein
MTKYMISVWYPEGGEPPPPDELEVIMHAVDAVHTEMMERGVWVFGGALHPDSTATVVRATGDRATGFDMLVTDGPYVESKEQLGGFSVVDVPDLDEALVWADKLARVLHPLPLEVRPFQD